MERIIQPEWLDELPGNDARAVRSRRDLRRVNAWMGNAGTMARALNQECAGPALERLVEIGAGDGAFLLSVAERLGARRDGRARSVLLLDRQILPAAETLAQFEKVNWEARALRADVFDYLGNGAETVNAILANLFLHHFSADQLGTLFRLALNKTRALVAVEPRRSRFALFFSRRLGLIGCNAVTRHDAVISVRAGFAGRELSALWPDPEGWELTERAAGWCSHLFVARRKN